MWFEYKPVYEKGVGGEMYLDLNIMPFPTNSQKFYLVT